MILLMMPVVQSFNIKLWPRPFEMTQFKMPCGTYCIYSINCWMNNNTTYSFWGVVGGRGWPLIWVWVGVGGWGGGCLFKAERSLTFSAFRMGAYSRWALIQGWALIRINTVGPSLTNFQIEPWSSSGGVFTSFLTLPSLDRIGLYAFS